MRITFLTPHIGSSGGVRIIMGYAHRLAQKGNQVTVVCPMKSRLRAFFHNLIRTKPAWIDLSARLKFVAVLSEKYLPQADAIVATAWQTAGLVNTLPADRGKKFYLIQHYESLFHGNKAEVDVTYQYPLRQIVVSTWLKEIMLKQFNSHAELIEDPVDLDVLYPTRSAFNKNKVIGLLSHPWEWKGTSEGIECFKRAQKQIPGIKLIMFGAQPNTFNVPCEYYCNPDRNTLRAVLNRIDIFLSASWKEGFGLTAAEALACGCGLVTTDNGGCRDYAMHEQTALVSPEKDLLGLTNNLIRLINDERLLTDIAHKGRLHIQRFSWGNAVNKLERILQP